MPKEAAELRPTFARGSDFAALGKGVLADLEKFVSGSFLCGARAR